MLTSPRRTIRATSGTLLAALALAAGGGAGCSGAGSAFGASIPEATENATDFLSALAARFGPVRRSPQLAGIRPRYVRAALVPSRIFGDSSLWTGFSGETRILGVAGTTGGDRYQLGLQPHIPTPARPGDSRQYFYLTRLDGDEYEWDATSELAVGRVGAAALRDAIARALAAFEGKTEAQIRHDYSTTMPRTSGALGRLFSLDTLHAVPLRDGTTALTLGIAVHAEQARGEFPHFVAYLEKYVLPSRFHFVVRDRGGAPWIDAATSPGFLTLRLRLHDGELAPLSGPARPLPDSLLFTGEAYAKALFFDVGVSRLSGDLVPLRGPSETGFTLRFAREPQWHLPPVVGHMVRGSLRRPFQGHGILLRLAFRDSPAGAQTLGEADLHVDVQESAIVRWLNSLGSAAMSDVTAAVELERDRFVGEAFAALEDDLRVRIASLP